jgi:hypothetical protein
MDGVLRAYRAVYDPAAPVRNLSMAGDGAALRDQSQWAAALRSGRVTAWVAGRVITVSGPPGTPVPVTVPAGTTAGPPGSPAAWPAGAVFGQPYGGERSAYVTLGAAPLRLALGAAPFRQPPS